MKLLKYAVFNISSPMKIFGRYHALLKTSCLGEDTIERLHIKRRKGEKNDPFQNQYDHRLRSLLALYYGTEQYRRFTSRAFTGKYGGVTERFSSVNGRNCLVHLSNTAVNGSVTDGVLVDLGTYLRWLITFIYYTKVDRSVVSRIQYDERITSELHQHTRSSISS